METIDGRVKKLEKRVLELETVLRAVNELLLKRTGQVESTEYDELRARLTNSEQTIPPVWLMFDTF